MATTENLHNGTGSQDSFSFTFPYINDTDIKVSVGGTLKTVTTHYTLHTPTTIKFTSGNLPPSGTSNVRIYRETADTALQATFYPGSAIRAADLNDNFTQNLYVVQEGNNKIESAWQTGDETIISTETWTGNDTTVATTGAIDGRIGTKIDDAMHSDVLGGTDISKTTGGGQVTLNHDVSGANVTVNNSDGNVIQDITVSAQGHVTSVGSYNLDGRYYTETELTNGQLDSRYYTETELTNGQLDGRYYTETELSPTANAGANVLDARYYTETEVDTNFYKLGSAGEIASGETWAASDTKIATTAAIDARITDLVDDVGGFVPIANETSFPNANPDVNNGAGTLVSIKALSSSFTSNGSGVATISNGTVGNSTVTINGLENSTTYAEGYGMIVETTSTLNTYTFHRQTPKATEVTTLAGSIANINTVGNNIAAVNTVHTSLTTITAVNNNSTNINAVNANSSNINAAVSNATNINAAVANATNINSVAGNSANINAVAGELLFSEDLGAITDALTTGSGNDINTVATNITNVNTFANVYRIASSAPSSSLDEGDLWYDSTGNVLKYYNGTTWTVTAAAGLSNIVEDTTPELAGHLDCNDKNLTEVGTVSGDNLQIDFGTLS